MALFNNLLIRQVLPVFMLLMNQVEILAILQMSLEMVTPIMS